MFATVRALQGIDVYRTLRSSVGLRTRGSWIRIPPGALTSAWTLERQVAPLEWRLLVLLTSPRNSKSSLCLGPRGWPKRRCRPSDQIATDFGDCFSVSILYHSNRRPAVFCDESQRRSALNRSRYVCVTQGVHRRGDRQPRCLEGYFDWPVLMRFSPRPTVSPWE